MNNQCKRGLQKQYDAKELRLMIRINRLLAEEEIKIVGGLLNERRSDQMPAKERREGREDEYRKKPVGKAELIKPATGGEKDERSR